MVGVRVKASGRADASALRHLRWFSQDGPGRTRQFTGIIFCLGSEKLSFGNRLFALPVSSLWSRSG